AVVEKIALSHPDISIRFIQNNQNKLYTSGNHNLKDLIYTVFGREFTSNLLAVNAQEGDIQVSGFIGKPVIARSNRNYENYFINGRYIRSSVISKAIEEAYKPFMMQHKYPFTMLHFTIQQDTLDVNVHPTKMELRFSDGEAVYRAVVKAVADALAHKELIPEVSLAEKKEKEAADLAQRLSPRPEPFEVKRRESMNRAAQPAAQDKASSSASYARTPPPKPSYVNELMPEWLKVRKREQEAAANAMKDSNATQNTASTFSEKLQDISKADSTSNKYIGDKQDQVPTLAEDQSNAPAPKEPEQLDLFDGKLLDPKARLRHKLIGQLFDTYWMVEYNEQLFIIDQHAAHEKVLYEKTIKTLKTRQYDTQMVEPPIILTLNMNEEVLLSRYMSYFTGMGFEIEPFGGREYAVRGVPANLFSIAQKELLIEMIDGLSDDISVHNPDIIYERVASMSCKAAVKGHHSLSAAEANELIDQLLQLDNPYACPHGRPTIISMTKYELEKKLKRIV
ncbi:MAG: DNA mismatch repair protein MutL, partial [Clostridium sp.]|nr:DNA mismatch repair protein MutL [Clostridium sp.]